MSCTPDGVLWNDAELNHNELDEVIKELWASLTLFSLKIHDDH
jgi:hypothetical protein